MQYLISDCVDRSADRQPDQPAALYLDEQLSYEQLARYSNQLAWTLEDQAVRRFDRVGIYMPKALESAVAIHGILKAGAAYVPLDPGAPAKRIASIIQDCGIRCLISSQRHRRKLRRLAREAPAIDLVIGSPDDAGWPWRSVPWDALASYRDDRPPEPGTLDQDIAYILYTSGSTGKPKGIIHSHASGLAFARLVTDALAFDERDRLSNHAPLHFDLSTLDYFCAALIGATLAVIPEEYTKLPASLAELIERQRLTVLYMVPMALTQLLLHGALEQRDWRALRWIIFAGEPFPIKHLRALMQKVPQARYCNIYGPTETNGVSYHVVPAIPEATDPPLPIGRLFANMEALVVDPEDRPVEPGQAGELLVRTPTLMAGYWGDPERNARAFYRRETHGIRDDLFYRTGDLVRETPADNYHFLDRRDNQVKIRGYRVELDEIEVCLSGHDAVSQAAAVAIADEQGSQRLAAAVVLAAGGEASEQQLRAHCSDRLPQYAVPPGIAVVDSFPQTSTGKLDRRALRESLQQTSPVARPDLASQGDPVH